MTLPALFSVLGRILTPAERHWALAVLALMVLTALLEVAGVASIVPFLAVLGNPGLVELNPILQRLDQFLAPRDHAAFLFILALGSLGVVLVSAAVKTLTLYTLRRYANDLRSSVSSRLMSAYLGQEYEFFLPRDSADLSKRILGDTYLFVQNVIIPILDIASYGLVLIGLLLLLVVVDPALALGAVAVLGGAYLLIYVAARGVLARVGAGRSLTEGERFRTAAEAFGGIKEIKVSGHEAIYSRRFAGASQAYARYLSLRDVLAHVPRYGIEVVGFGGLIGISLVLIGRGGDLGSVLPVLGLYGFAGYRLLPAAQMVYAGFSQLRFASATLESMIEDLALPQVVGDAEPEVIDCVPVPIEREIRFEAVSYCYPHAPIVALVDLSFTIPTNASLGIIGHTGAGKTTLVDILLGLLEPVAGDVLVDGVPLRRIDRSRWRRSVGYVPQSIFLANATIAENIAFGVDPAAIKIDAVERAARAAQIHEFIVHEAPQGYATEVGERGVRLSGGQRQRIGIARALYRNPALLVFDEATSALDDGTEAAVMEAVAGLRGSRTIVMIAHRLSTLETCDLVIEIEHGRLLRQGPRQHLLRRAAFSSSLT